MLDDDIIIKLKERYSNIHPLIFHRSQERAKTNGELFDILDSIPDIFPITWCENSHRWITSNDLLTAKEFFEE